MAGQPAAQALGGGQQRRLGIDPDGQSTPPDGAVIGLGVAFDDLVVGAIRRLGFIGIR